MSYLCRPLGDVDDPFDDEYNADGGQDPRAAYVAWAAAVRQYGGTVTVMPNDPAGARADAAARYPFDVIFPPPAMTLNPIFHKPPDAWSSNSAYGYYRAPGPVVLYAATGMTSPNTVPGEPPPPKPAWYDDLIKYGKYAAIGVVGLAALSALSTLRRGAR